LGIAEISRKNTTPTLLVQTVCSSIHFMDHDEYADMLTLNIADKMFSLLAYFNGSFL
jgi:hypothetical protein